MAKASIVSLDQLDAGFILTPERYDSLRLQKEQSGSPICNLCQIINKTLSRKNADISKAYLIIDTGDVKEGFVRYKKTVDSTKIGSNKKLLKVGDVIVSRLRPYLRQVGYIDKALFDSLPKNTIVMCSTEFYILRSESSDISYIAPYLLTHYSQNILNASQEGGHHPRFTQNTLESLKVDTNTLSLKVDISNIFKQSISNLREGEQGIRKLLDTSLLV